MPEEYDNDLLKQGILHFKSKEYALARRYFERALDAADDLQTQAQANFYLSQVVDDPAQKRQFLEETLAVDMGHAGARRALAILDGKLDPAGIVAPDAIPAPTPGTQAAQGLRFTCLQCGGRMVYAPDGASLVCENCRSKQSISAGNPSAEQDFFVAMADGKGFRRTISVKTFQCRGCGAHFLLAPSEISSNCAYCGSLHVLDMQETRELVEPDAILPMAFDQKQATGFLAQWFAEKRIIPQPGSQPPRGLYQPVWTFDLIGCFTWSGRAVRDNREVPVSGESPAQFNAVCIPGTPKMGAVFIDLLPGFSLSAATAYNPRFLAGWPALVYETTMAEAALEARRISVERLCRDITLDHGRVIDLQYSTSGISITSYRLILLPVWLTTYSIKELDYRVVINGQTGVVSGETPKRSLNDRIKNLFDA